MDIVHDLGDPLPAKVLAYLLGLPSEDSAVLKPWADVVGMGSDDVEGAVADQGARGVGRERARERRRLGLGALGQSRAEDGGEAGAQAEGLEERLCERLRLGGHDDELVTRRSSASGTPSTTEVSAVASTR